MFYLLWNIKDLLCTHYLTLTFTASGEYSINIDFYIYALFQK